MSMLCLNRAFMSDKIRKQLSCLFAVMAEGKLAEIPAVSIDPDGVFKYVLIKVHSKDANSEEPVKTLVRGFKWGAFHADIYEKTQQKVEDLGFETECVGGGRIEHNSSEKRLKVYGYSQGYGKADHEVTVELLKKQYPNYNISWSDEGY